MSNSTMPVRLDLPVDGKDCPGSVDVVAVADDETIYARMMARMQRLFGSQPWLEDAVHTAFETFLQKRSSFRGDGRIEAFADTIALNAARDCMRKQRRAVLLRELFFTRGDWSRLTPSPEARTQDRDRLRRLNSILERMGPTCRIPYLLYHVENMTVAQIASGEGVTEDAIRKRIERARLEIHSRAAGDPVLCEWLEDKKAQR